MEAAPVVRTVYECAITAHWRVRVDGTIDFLHEANRQRANMEKQVLKVQPDFIPVHPADETDLPPAGSAGGSARRFETLCGDLNPGGASAWADDNVPVNTMRQEATSDNCRLYGSANGFGSVCSSPGGGSSPAELRAQLQGAPFPSCWHEAQPR